MNNRQTAPVLDLRVNLLRDPEQRVPGTPTVKAPFLVTIQQSEGIGETPTMNASCMAVADRSSSMDQAGKWPAVQSALTDALRTLSAGEFGIIAFNSQPTELGSARAGDRRAVERLVKAVQSTAPCNGTNLDRAMAHALPWLRQRQGARSLLILSDGQTENEPECRKLADEFAANEIVAHFLATDDVNLELAKYITDRTNGRLEYLNRLTAQELSTFLAQQLHDTQNVVAQNVRVGIRCSGGVGLVAAARAYPDVIHFPPANPFMAAIGNLIRGDALRLYAEVVAPMPDQDARLHAADIDLLYDVPQLGRRDERVSAPLLMTCVAGASPQPSSDVLHFMHLVKAEEELARAAQEQDPARAIELLQSAQRRTRLAGDTRKTQVVDSLIQSVRTTRTITDGVRKTATTLGRRTKIVT